MLKLFLQSQQKKAVRKLSELRMTDSSCSQQTSFQELYYLVRSEISKPKQLLPYLQAMKKSELSPQKMLKFCILVHIYVQNSSGGVEVETVQEFVAMLLEKCPAVIEKYEGREFKKDSSFVGKGKGCNRSCNQSPATSTRSEEMFVCKEIYLVTHIIRPYIGYLMKFFASQASLTQILRKQRIEESHQAWMLINYLKLITSISANFTMIGRYFINSYGGLVVLLTKTLARDINKMMGQLSSFVSHQNYKINESPPIDASLSSVTEFVNLLEQISKLNDDLFTIYLGKYFVRYLLDIPEPKWIITNSKQFDGVYHAVRKEVKETGRERAKSKKRSKSVLVPSEKKIGKY